MNAVVTVKSIKVFGDSKEYPADEVTMKKFVKWAMETKADLRAHPMLNEQLRVLDQCITTEAMTVLWACTALQQAGVPRAYPSEAVKSAVTQANLRARCDFHITWLTDIVAACAPNTNAHIIKEIEKIKFGEGATGGITGRFYQEEDVTRYIHGQAATAATRTLRSHAHRPCGQVWAVRTAVLNIDLRCESQYKYRSAGKPALQILNCARLATGVSP